MKTAIVGINAKYIHPNLAIRLLKANTNYETDILEFTIKDNENKIIEKLNTYEIITFSCYIWNIEMIKSLIKKLNNKIIILGGPEVSYNAEYYLNNNLADYVIKNEGEEAFNLLLGYLHQDNSLDVVPNLYHKNGFTFDKLVDLNKIKLAYDLLDDLENKIIYIETSRGCPFKCSYCMASLDNKLRFFDYELIKNELKKLIDRNGRVFKFLDRTFNANKKMFLGLIDYIIESHKENMSFQFEITGDLLDEDVINYINNNAPKNLFRFEIGIQSTNIKSNKAVYRIQNNEKLFRNIKLIQEANVIDLHLDLIAGLPYEDYPSFINTFNEVLALRPLELQLGFLKLLHGTTLEKEASSYGYSFNQKAPYDIIENAYLSANDINNIHICEEAFDSYYNSQIFKNSLSYILDNEKNAFDFFYNLGLTDFKGKTLEERFKILDNLIINKKYYSKAHEIIILEYLNYYNLKPKAWWNEALDKKTKNNILREIVNKINYNINILYKYSILINLDTCYIIAIYQNDNKEIIKINK